MKTKEQLNQELTELNKAYSKGYLTVNEYTDAVYAINKQLKALIWIQ